MQTNEPSPQNAWPLRQPQNLTRPQKSLPAFRKPFTLTLQVLFHSSTSRDRALYSYNMADNSWQVVQHEHGKPEVPKSSNPTSCFCIARSNNAAGLDSRSERRTSLDTISNQPDHPETWLEITEKRALARLFRCAKYEQTVISEEKNEDPSERDVVDWIKTIFAEGKDESNYSKIRTVDHVTRNLEAAYATVLKGTSPSDPDVEKLVPSYNMLLAIRLCHPKETLPESYLRCLFGVGAGNRLLVANHTKPVPDTFVAKAEESQRKMDQLLDKLNA